jgi:hypothetical protein
VPKPDRAELVMFVFGPVVLLWVLLLFVSTDVGLRERFDVGLLFSVLWVPLIYLRVRN